MSDEKKGPIMLPDDFMFELTVEEFQLWRSQFGTSKADKMGLRYSPFAFTETGVAQLSAILNSERASNNDNLTTMTTR